MRKSLYVSIFQCFPAIKNFVPFFLVAICWFIYLYQFIEQWFSTWGVEAPFTGNIWPYQKSGQRPSEYTDIFSIIYNSKILVMK